MIVRWLFGIAVIGLAMCSCFGDPKDPVCTSRVSVSVPVNKRLGIQLDNDLRVTMFAPDSPVKEVGRIDIGDTVVSVNGKSVSSLSDFGSMLRQSKGTHELLFQSQVSTCLASGASSVVNAGIIKLRVGRETVVEGDFQRAHYGESVPMKNDNDEPLRVVLADPLNACEPLSADSVQGAAVLILRGDCTFLTKSRNAMQSGAAVVVMMNTEPGIPRIPKIGASASDTVPVVTVSERTRRELRRFVDQGNREDLSIVFVDDPAVGLIWESLNDLMDVNRWPVAPREQRKMYFNMSLLYHPDKVTGSNERFEHLNYVYKKAKYYTDPELQASVHFDQYISEN